ncbi:MAG: hypothetical protein ABEI77_09790 [Halorientalis sp.]
MDIQRMTLLLIQLVALLFPFVALVLRLTITEVDEMGPDGGWLPVRDLVLVGGGFSLIFLTGASILLVQVIVRTTGYGLTTPFGLALAFLLVSLVLFGLITVVFLWGVLVSDTE